MNEIINLINLAITGVKIFFLPPMNYFALLGIVGGLISLIKRRNA